MSKHNNKEHKSELEQLRSLNRKLKSENRNLKKRLNSLKKREHLFEEQEEVEDDDCIVFIEEERTETCPVCTVGSYKLIDLIHAKFLSCSKCGHRQKVK